MIFPDIVNADNSVSILQIIRHIYTQVLLNH
jgi:hypothetical protein